MEQNLRVPGPTPLPSEVRQAQAEPMIDHRGTEFAEMLRESCAGIATLIATDGEILLLTASGTGAMEAAVVNTLSPGDRVLSVTIGSFGDRFADIATAFGVEVDRLAFDWGAAADPAALTARLAEAPPYRAVLLTHNETSTGVTNPLHDLVAAVRAAPGDSLVIVDGISGLGALEFEMDAWGVDLVVSASQKAWMGSPGIGIVGIGPRARAAEERARLPRYYWSFAEARGWARKGQTPWTPAVSILYGLRVGVRRLLEEGREATWERHVRVSRGVQAGVEALGLRLVAPPDHRSATVTAAWLPDGLEWAGFNAEMRRRGLIIAGGQGQLAGRILRFGHMGDVGIDEMADAIEVMGQVLADTGREVDVQAAVSATRSAGEPVVIAPAR